jgi:hypothetical protein
MAPLEELFPAGPCILLAGDFVMIGAAFGVSDTGKPSAGDRRLASRTGGDGPMVVLVAGPVNGVVSLHLDLRRRLSYSVRIVHLALGRATGCANSASGCPRRTDLWGFGGAGYDTICGRLLCTVSAYSSAQVPLQVAVMLP